MPFRRRRAYGPVMRDSRWSQIQFAVTTNLTVNAGSTSLTRSDLLFMSSLTGTASTDLQLPFRRLHVASIVWSSAFMITAPAVTAGSYQTFYECVAIDDSSTLSTPVRLTFDQSFNSIASSTFDSATPTKIMYRDFKVLPCGDSAEANNMPRYVNNGTRKIKVRKQLNEMQMITAYLTTRNPAAAQTQISWAIAGTIFYKLTV